MGLLKVELALCLLAMIIILSSGWTDKLDSPSPLKPIYPHDLGKYTTNRTCPGLYCGRSAVYNESKQVDWYSQCGPCPRGEYADKMSICQSCQGSPTLYDWLYLGFMVIVSLTMHVFFIDFFFKNNESRSVIVLHSSAFVECFLSALLSLLVVPPLGHLTLHSCGVSRLSDWYTMMKNPKPDYSTKLHCTQEAVFPLYTLVFLSYTFQLLFMMLFRPFLSIKFCKNQGRYSIYAALYFLPILVVIHAVCAGLIYYSYPLIIIIVSLVTHAAHFARSEINTPKQLISKKRDVLILLAHWLIHGYGIIAITRLQNPIIHGSLLALVPMPAAFYLATAKFTEPSKIRQYES